ncbi:hypothetical protein [Staphylococcus gallinarum]|uniref:hypothetical protein n=1 Tax=Staphylococcus gallinarum TaxID=1293 RepID=UPI000E6A19EA|nr:hypothetical protein [Staphylococcus gallinarum]RIL19587.1 hypothetical protein BUY99_11835 [Staphylococcus gallinarum]
MAKIKKTDITKLSKIEQQIEELKAQKKKQEEELAKNIGDHFLNKIDIDLLESADELYEIIDEVLEKFNNKHITESTENDDNEFVEDSESETITMNSSQSESF